MAEINKDQLPAGAYIHDAAEVSRFGRNALLGLGALTLVGDGLAVIGDLINERSGQADLIYAGETGVFFAAGVGIAHVLYRKLSARLEVIRSATE